MAEDKPYKFEAKNKKNDDSIDIIDKLTVFVNYLNIDGQMLLKPSKIDLQNEMKFEQRAEQIIKRHRRHDQFIVEENTVNELQKYINVINNDLDNKLNKKGTSELESKDITEMYDCLMNVKMLILKSSKNAKSLKDFIKLNKVKI
ncbi:unnamed protein product [Macrosiphum euphorbiae]|uniref:Uncharacterized protein n=1 Tax=Macrosiphum euphorbiae TaxID=13131 RepID=A0AAV0VRR2_9HEMI|nr:unnamed protein product [Macrosiphum euphorbiae]